MGVRGLTVYGMHMNVLEDDIGFFWLTYSFWVVRFKALLMLQERTVSVFLVDLLFLRISILEE